VHLVLAELYGRFNESDSRGRPEPRGHLPLVLPVSRNPRAAVLCAATVSFAHRVVQTSRPRVRGLVGALPVASTCVTVYLT
jgi:hypothetical protein